VILEIKTLAGSVIRHAGLYGVAKRVRMLWHDDRYEDRFSDAMLAEIGPDDCVWDVGANVGYYTERFAARARCVVAFEPIAENMAVITAKAIPNVQCVPVALGAQRGFIPMFADRHLSSLVIPRSKGVREERVMVVPGDELCEIPRPTVVKIDVEGYEPEVISGMMRVLSNVRAVFLEVHFWILEQRGMRNKPAALVKCLRELGFKIRWADASHVVAFRKTEKGRSI